MPSSVGDVVAQLLAAHERLAAAAITANRAKADAEQASTHYTEAAQGSDHPKLKAAITAAGTAGAKSDKVARLINEARDQIAAYINHIAPGAAPTDHSPAEAFPDGQRLVDEASRAANRARRISQRSAQNAESVGDLAKKVLEYFEAARTPSTAGTTQGPKLEPTVKIGRGLDADEAQAIAIVAAAALAAAMQAVGRRRERKERRSDK